MGSARKGGIAKVSSALFREQSGRVIAALAAEMGCDAAQLRSERLEVVTLPADGRPGRAALAATCGVGTVVSVPGELVGWVRESAPRDMHFRAMQPCFLAELAAEIERRGLAAKASAHGFSLGFALDEEKEIPEIPAGFTIRAVERGWIGRYRPSAVFDNALGEMTEPDRIEKTRQAVAVLDAEGAPAAIAGWWDEGQGRDEIGVDVRRDARGIGLAKLVVTAATHRILETGRTPFYSCGATNVRSHRNALSCGFLPVFTIGMVRGEPVSP